MAKHPELIRGQIFRDPAVSAWKNEFAARPGGKELAEKVQSGDHVIFWGMKRAFRLHEAVAAEVTTTGGDQVQEGVRVDWLT